MGDQTSPSPATLGSSPRQPGLQARKRPQTLHVGSRAPGPVPLRPLEGLKETRGALTPRPCPRTLGAPSRAVSRGGQKPPARSLCGSGSRHPGVRGQQDPQGSRPALPWRSLRHALRERLLHTRAACLMQLLIRTARWAYLGLGQDGSHGQPHPVASSATTHGPPGTGTFQGTSWQAVEETGCPFLPQLPCAPAQG